MNVICIIKGMNFEKLILEFKNISNVHIYLINSLFCYGVARRPMCSLNKDMDVAFYIGNGCCICLLTLYFWNHKYLNTWLYFKFNCIRTNTLGIL